MLTVVIHDENESMVGKLNFIFRQEQNQNSQKGEEKQMEGRVRLILQKYGKWTQTSLKIICITPTYPCSAYKYEWVE